MPLGAHMSTSGGVEKSLQRGHLIGCETIQIFVTNPNQWKTKSLDPEDVRKFEAAEKETRIDPVVAHARYLINLATPDDELWEKSVGALGDEIRLSESLSLPYIVLHPGAHMDSGDEAGIERTAHGLDRLREELTDVQVKVLLETTAGQGTNIGYTFEHLADIMDKADDPSWLGVCFDTCHAFAAGYELRTEEGYAEAWKRFDQVIGLKRLHCIHVNDSKGGLGCRLDRHEHIGKGKLGLEAFRHLLNDSALNGLPMLLETPKDPDMKQDVENLATLRSLIETKGDPA